VAVTEVDRLFGGRAHVATVPTTGEVIKVSANEGDGSKAQLRLPLAWILPMHQTEFGRWRPLLLRAWVP